MSVGYTKTITAGVVATDLELIKTSSGRSRADILVYVNRDYKNADGKYDSDLQKWEAWGSTADYAVANIVKGDTVVLEGQFRRDVIQKPDGKKQEYTKFIISNLKQLTWKKRELVREEAPAFNTGPTIEVTPDDLPF